MRRKKFAKDWGLLDYRAIQSADYKRPADEAELVQRMRLFVRFHSSRAEHEVHIDDLLKAKRLRTRITMLQAYRACGITTFAEAERFEIEIRRRNRDKSEEKRQWLAENGGRSSFPRGFAPPPPPSFSDGGSSSGATAAALTVPAAAAASSSSSSSMTLSSSPLAESVTKHYSLLNVAEKAFCESSDLNEAFYAIA
jgi:transcriptional adapter 2-alpha